MGAIILEGVLFVALIATGGAFLFWLLIHFFLPFYFFMSLALVLF